MAHASKQRTGWLARCGTAAVAAAAMLWGAPAFAQDKAAAASEPSGSGKQRVYTIELNGEFGRDITQTPIKEAVNDAKKNNADYIIFVMNNEWSGDGGLMKLPDDAAKFDELFRAEEITPIFTTDIPNTWTKQPKIVFWVKQAMGGACFLPFISQNIYFAPDARMGGVGNLSELFGATGDEVVRQKQYSLRMGHAEGWANVGGYPYQIVRAMARSEYVLSYKIVGGEVVLLERMPESPDEFLLTDDGKDKNADTLKDRVRSDGNDVLTLNARVAQELKVSKGTADSIQDIIFMLGISRNYELIPGRAPQIMKNWSRSVDKAERDMKELVKEYQQIQVQGTYNERKLARGKKIAKLNEMIAIEKRFEEVITPFLYENGLPTVPQLEELKERIKLEQMADKK